MHAEPTELQAEDPFTLTVSITGAGNLEEIQRPDLARWAGRFHIEDLADHYLPATKTREFVYRLRPRTAGVRQVPPLPFVFFNPKIRPPERGYQTSLAPAIPLRVRPRDEVQPAQVEGGTTASATPASVYQLVDGAAVLRYDPPFLLPGGSALAALVLGPPAFAGLWYLAWRRCYPDAVRQSRKRRSRAAQHALRAIQRSGKLDAVGQAHQAEVALTGYMRQRLDLPAAEPVPAEVARHLEQAGASRALADEVARFFAACDAVRFAPGLMEKPVNWTAKATHLVLALEEEPWPVQFS
jgi:hypothetical protein